MKLQDERASSTAAALVVMPMQGGIVYAAEDWTALRFASIYRPHTRRVVIADAVQPIR
jgi:hypothetical protein